MNNEQFKQGVIYAVRLLSITTKSEKQLTDKLLEKGYPEDVAAKVLKELKSQGILNEQRTVGDAVSWAINGKHQGRRRIAMELKRKGFGKNSIDSALDNYTADNEREVAREIAERKLLEFQKLDPLKRKKKIYDHLMRKGFDYEICRTALSQAEAKGIEDLE